LLRLYLTSHHRYSQGDEKNGQNIVAHVNIDPANLVQEHQCPKQYEEYPDQHGRTIARTPLARKSFKTVADRTPPV